MPSTYAHYRFGISLLPTIPADARRTIQRFRRLFDVGLHGPDIFLYQSPLLKSSTIALGMKYHEQTGQVFFQRVCRAVRLARSEAAQAYLYGVLCHYCLDAAYHQAMTDLKTDDFSALEQETEFDRFLLETDGKVPPCSQDLSPHLQLTPGECDTVAKFYPPSTGNQIKDSLRSMALVTKVMAVPEGARRNLLAKGMGLFAAEYKGMLMGNTPNPRCAHLNEEMLSVYDRAKAQFPEMLQQLQAHMTYSAPFGPEFQLPFG